MGAKQVIFHCRSGARTKANARTLASAVSCDTYMMEGGLDAWKQAGLAVVTDRKQPIEIMRQVQIAAGSLVLLGVLLGATISPLFYALAGIVGAGLTVSGLTGTCAMARLLRVMPWNRVSEA
jgi:rhodanese-related sulfurtransferase